MYRSQTNGSNQWKNESVKNGSRWPGLHCPRTTKSKISLTIVLVKGYWSANPNGTSSNLKKFLVNVKLAIKRKPGACPDGQCEMKCFLAVPHNLLTLLVQKLHLQILKAKQMLYTDLPSSRNGVLQIRSTTHLVREVQYVLRALLVTTHLFSRSTRTAKHEWNS